MNKSANPINLKLDSSRVFWKIIGYISVVLTIIVLSFQIGQYVGKTDAKKEELDKFISYIAQIKNGVSITLLSCNKNKVLTNEVVEILVTIKNKNNFECDLWFGASIRNKNRTEYWNTAEDIIITLAPSGLTNTNRLLTIPTNTQSGTYDLIVKLWFGKISDPTHSELISSAVLLRYLKVNSNH